MPEGTPATTPRVETKPISAKTESEKGQDNNLLARTKDRARNLGASLKERFGKSNQTPEQKIKTIADIRTQQDAILDNRGKNPQGWMDQLRATQTPASEITSQTQTAEPIGNDPSKYAEWLQQQPGEYAKNGIDINPNPTDKTIIGRLGEKIQNRWVRKAPERGMEPKQKTPDADSFIKTESPTVSRYRELMQKNWANKEMSPQAFHDAKVKAQREAFGPPKSKDSPQDAISEPTVLQEKTTDARKGELTGTPAEGMNVDPRYAAIKEELEKRWLQEHPGEDLLSNEGQNYSLGYTNPSEGPLPTLTSDTDTLFRERYPEDANAYAAKERTRVYDNPNDDPAIKQLEVDILRATNLDSQDGNMWGKANLRENVHQWNRFIDLYPEKARAYAESGHEQLKRTFEGRERVQQYKEQQERKKTPTVDTTAEVPAQPVTETTTLKTSSTELADKTAQFDAIQDLYDQGRLTKEEYNKKLANLKNPLPSPKTDITAPDSTTDSSTEAYYREQQEAETDRQLAKTIMEEKLNALGLAKNRDEDPRWKAAFKESFEAAKMSLDSSMGEGAWTAQYKKIVADSRATADRALEQQNKEHFDAYIKYGVYESRIIDPEAIKILGTITDSPTKANVDRLKQEYPEKAALYQYELKGLGKETDTPADGAKAEGTTAEAAKEQTTPETLLEGFGINMGSDGAKKLVDAMKTNPDVASAISLLGNELNISLNSAEEGSDSNVKNRFLQILLALAAAIGITLLGATKITGEAADAAGKAGV